NAGRTLLSRKRYSLSIKCFLKAYNIQPLLKYAVIVGKIYKKLDKFDEIKKLHQQLVDSNPSRENIDYVNAEFKELLQR
ncbi:MAG TPA: hypothetical protein VF941_09940, partial [Clostridia bacterium]